MSRPPKPRRICFAPRCRRFEGDRSLPAMKLEGDEVEALRLADLESLEQSEAADRLGVSRGTFQRMLYSARGKVAFALTSGCTIELTGAESTFECGAAPKRCRFCHKQNTSINQKGVSVMKIAVTCENHQVFQHFGHTPEFALFDIDGGLITAMRIESAGDSGHGALAGFLKERGVDLLICGGIGGGAQMALAEAGIKLVGGVEGDVIEAVGQYLKGTLASKPDFSCSHHEHADGHHCGEHGHHCGEPGHHCGGDK